LEMDAQRETFVTGATDRGVSAEKASFIFDQISAFAGYGFNKSHAAAYALVAYQTAYLKANHPVEFLAASMTYDMGNTDRLSVFRQELQFQGIPLMTPDVNRSFPDFAVEETGDGVLGIRYALGALKNVGVQAMHSLVGEREANGPFQGLDDFTARLDAKVTNKRLLESLVRAGALDCLHRNRAALFDSIEMVLRHANVAAEERASNQVSLFAVEGGIQAAKVEVRDRPEWPATEQLREEFDAIGFYLSSHPLESYGAALTRVSVVRSDQIESTMKAKGKSGRINLAGMVISYKIRTSAKGSRYAFLQLSDQAGVYEVTVFSEVLANSRELMETGKALLVRVDVRIEEGQTRITVAKLEPLDDAIQHAAKGLLIYVRDASAIEPLRGLVEREGRGRGRIKLIIQRPEREIDIALPEAFKISGTLRAAVKSLPGIIDVRDL
jgi:DNA polymerase-3 subunit alpha